MNEKSVCKVCGEEIPLTEAFCPHCSFPQITYPKSISEEIRKYEDNRVEKYRELWENKNKGEKLPPLSGYLVVMQGEDFQQVLPVYNGKNVFGKYPRYEDGLFRTVIDLSSDGLRNENFSLETDQKGFVVARLIEGSWSINSLTNSPIERILSNGDIILINDLKIIFIAK